MILPDRTVHQLIDNAISQLNGLPQHFTYHNIEHTIRVVSACTEIALGSNMSNDEVGFVRLIAWYHDIGFTQSRENHEEVSVEILMELLKPFQLDNQTLRTIEEAILSTQVSSEPLNEIGKIICDADTFHLSSRDYFQYSELLRKEISYFSEENMDHEKWHKENTAFFKSHRYHTKYGLSKFQPGKMNNFGLLLNQLQSVPE